MLVCQLLAKPAQILSYNSLSVYNSLSAAIHLYNVHDPGRNIEEVEVVEPHKILE